MQTESPTEVSQDRGEATRLFVILAAAYCALKIVLLLVYSFSIQYQMDEYWQGGESIHIPNFYGDYDPVKTVLYTYYYALARLLTHTSNQLMTIARVQTFIVVAAMLAIVWRAWRNIGYTREQALFALCVLLSFSNFLEQSFRVRSDSVALFFDVLAVAITCAGDFTSRRRAFLTGLTVAVAFLCTQKAVYAAFAIGVGLSITIFLAAGLKRTIVVGLSCFGGFLAALAAYTAAFEWRGRINVLQSIFTRPMDLVQHATQYYPNMVSYTTQTLTRNWFAYSLCAIGLLAAATRWRSATPQKRFAVIFSVVFVTSIFLHNQPWPYLFVSAIVFLAPWSAELISLVSERSPVAMRTMRIGIVLVLAISLMRNLYYLRKDSALQNAVSDQAESLLGPGDAYEDGTGMITTRRLAASAWWDAMAIRRLLVDAQRGDYSYTRSVFDAQPKVWIWNYRVAAVAPIIREALNHSYVRVYRNVLVAGAEVGPNARIFTAPWSGTYTLYGKSGRIAGLIRINGQPVATPVTLKRGRYVVSGLDPAATDLFLLPADLPIPSVVRVTAPPLDLYEAVYE